MKVDFKSAELFSFSWFSIGPRFLNSYWRALFIACDPAIRTGLAGILEGYFVSGRLTDDYDGIKSLIPGPVLCQPKQKE